MTSGWTKDQIHSLIKSDDCYVADVVNNTGQSREQVLFMAKSLRIKLKKRPRRDAKRHELMYSPRQKQKQFRAMLTNANASFERFIEDCGRDYSGGNCED